MKKLLLFGSAAAILAACGTVPTSGQTTNGAGSRAGVSTGVRSASQETLQNLNANRSGNAGDLDVNRINPPVTKGARPAPVSPAQPQQQAPTRVNPGGDRCGGGMGGASTNAATASGKHFPLPACMAQ